MVSFSPIFDNSFGLITLLTYLANYVEQNYWMVLTWSLVDSHHTGYCLLRLQRAGLASGRSVLAGLSEAPRGAVPAKVLWPAHGPHRWVCATEIWVSKIWHWHWISKLNFWDPFMMCVCVFLWQWDPYSTTHIATSHIATTPQIKEYYNNAFPIDRFHSIFFTGNWRSPSCLLIG